MKVGHVIDPGEALEIRDGLHNLVEFIEESAPLNDSEDLRNEHVVTFTLNLIARFVDARVMCVSQQDEIAELRKKLPRG